MSDVPCNERHACHDCGAYGMTPTMHHCWFCGVHRNCDACRPSGRAAICVEGGIPDFAIFTGKYHSRRDLLLHIPSANEIRAQLGLALLPEC